MGLLAKRCDSIPDAETLLKADRLRVLEIIDHYAPKFDRDARAMIARGIKYTTASPGKGRAAARTSSAAAVDAHRAKHAAGAAARGAK